MREQNFSYYVSQRISRQRGSAFSVLIKRIAIGSISLGLAVMLISFCIFGGFKQVIRDKIISFTGHIQITKYDLSNSYEEIPLSTQHEFFQKAQNKQIPHIAHIQTFSRKAALLKTDSEVAGAVLKGIDKSYQNHLFLANIIEGRMLEWQDSAYTNEIVCSKKIANALELAIGDEILCYFLQEQYRVRKLQIVGIYETGIEDFDDKLVYCDNKLIQRINNWEPNQVGGFEILVQDFTKLNPSSRAILEYLEYDMYLDRVTDMYRHFFDWFAMLERNVVIFLAVILFVAAFNIVSVLLIMITERTEMIGVLKALGARNKQIRRIFLFNGLELIGKGLLFGNLLGLGLCALQYYFQIIPLDPQNYYMSSVPIQWDWQMIIFSNLFTILLVPMILLLPTWFVTRISPIKALRFD
ncbi:MAG: ABC transporter permease [Bernardetiaceae bacterium]|nr:ABC transporter permease [Bernardetiaceae bacterium]